LAKSRSTRSAAAATLALRRKVAPLGRWAMQAPEKHIAVDMWLHGLSLRSTADGLKRVLAEHTAILDAIRSSDPDLARDPMHSHLKEPRDRLFSPRG
jgi:DNA-binding FadR family transcriptional regulator